MKRTSGKNTQKGARRAVARKASCTSAQTCTEAPAILGKFAFVKWMDACSKNGWWGGERPFTLQEITSAGWITADEADRITLVADLDHDTGNVCRTMSIPKGGISKIQIVDGHDCAKDFHIVPDEVVKVLKQVGATDDI